MSSGAGLIEALLALGMLVVVPLGVRLHPDLGPRWTLPLGVAAGLATVSLLVTQGTVAVALAVPWLVLALVATVVCGRRWLQERRGLLRSSWVAVPGYLAFGAAWLVFDRAALEPAGVTPPFVILTAVHFHYAGFVAALLVSLLRVRVSSGSPRGTVAAVVAVVGAPPIIAAGFALVGVLQIAGAVVLTAGLFVLAWLTLRMVVPSASDAVGRALLIVSSVAVFVPMLLAVQWAVGWNFSTPALSIPAMARTHGVLNAVGFSLCGIIGWLRIADGAAAGAGSRGEG